MVTPVHRREALQTLVGRGMSKTVAARYLGFSRTVVSYALKQPLKDADWAAGSSRCRSAIRGLAIAGCRPGRSWVKAESGVYGPAWAWRCRNGDLVGVAAEATFVLLMRCYPMPSGATTSSTTARHKAAR